MLTKYSEIIASNITNDTKRGLIFFQDKMAFTIGPVTLKEILDDPNITIVDTRKGEDYERSHIPNAISIPAAEISNFMSKLSKDKTTIVYCYRQQCHIASGVAVHLTEKGYPTSELEGGFDAWKNIYEFDVVS
ncbi:MAG: rhodanese-like domain-containing protein [Candidatus Gastranaerophilales bacterium]|nr:rhodanese-like domain-containing protein [Candidatus Gastranaerophilales bacterium]